MPWGERVGAHLGLRLAKSSDRKIPGQSSQYSSQGLVHLRVGVASTPMFETITETVSLHLGLKVTELTIDLRDCLLLLSQDNHRAQSQRLRSSARERVYETLRLQHQYASVRAL